MSARHIRRFDRHPNRGIDHPFQPHAVNNVDDPWHQDEVRCRLHDVEFTRCTLCSPKR